MSHQPPHLKLVNNTSGTCKVCPTTGLNSLTCPCSQQPMHDLWNHSRANGVASTNPVKTPPQVASAAPTQTGACRGQLRTVEPPAPLCSLQMEPLDTLQVQPAICCHITRSHPHNNASGDPSPLNYMYQQSHTFPASLLLTQHMVPVEPLALTAIGISTGASLPPKLHMDLAPGHF